MSSVTTTLVRQISALRQGKTQARCLLRSGTKRTIVATTTTATRIEQSHPSNSHTISGGGIIQSSTSIADNKTTGTTTTTTTTQRCFSVDNNNKEPDLRSYYHIEASNATRPDATALIVSGPDVDGMLASMTLTLAMGGCSLVELHAAKSDFCDRVHAASTGVRDIFYVVNKETGEPFSDDDLEFLAVELLESLRSPMTTLGRATKGTDAWRERLEGAKPYASIDEQIKIVPTP